MVAETLATNRVQRSNNRLTIVVLPAPEGPEITMSRPEDMSGVGEKGSGVGGRGAGVGEQGSGSREQGAEGREQKAEGPYSAFGVMP